jgi:hypothetical protein
MLSLPLGIRYDPIEQLMVTRYHLSSIENNMVNWMNMKGVGRTISSSLVRVISIANSTTVSLAALAMVALFDISALRK